MHRVEIGPDHVLTRVKIAEPPFFNWPALPIAAGGPTTTTVARA